LPRIGVFHLTDTMVFAERESDPLATARSLTGLARPPSGTKVARLDQVACESYPEYVEISSHAFPVKTGGARPYHLHAAVQFAVEALRVLIRHRDFAYEAAFAASQTDPPVCLTMLMPEDRIHEIGLTTLADDESSLRARPAMYEAFTRLPDFAGFRFMAQASSEASAAAMGTAPQIEPARVVRCLLPQRPAAAAARPSASRRRPSSCHVHEPSRGRNRAQGLNYART
jgi:hypothetical protein